jgi:D-glycero-alpha-D-manno-heptose-7-phosphate kinase
VILARAPYRISLGGGGTDLPSYYGEHGGFVLSAAIDKYLYICVNRPAADDLIRLKYSRYEEVTSPSEVEHDLVRPALQLLDLDAKLEIVSMADVPAGTGLGSSGTYLVTLLVALHELQGTRIDTQALAEMACHIEIDLAGHPSGKQDQYLAAFGGLTTLDIERDGSVTVGSLSATSSTLEDLQSSLLLYFTGMSRSSGAILGQQQAATRDGVAAVVDSLHETKELGFRIKAALEQGRLDDFGGLLHEHWVIKQKRSRDIGGSQVDRWYATALDAGALGGKVIGAGGGGFMMFYCPSGAKAGVRHALAEAGLREMPFAFESQGARVMVNF